jgi:VanZ family protein
MKEGKEISTYQRWLLYHGPAILYAGLIVTASSIPDLQGPDLHVVPFDKVAHFFEYAIFCFLVFRSISITRLGTRSNQTVLITFLLLAVFSALDEIHQKFVPGRSCDIADFAFDLAGGLLILVYMWLRKGRLDRF